MPKQKNMGNPTSSPPSPNLNTSLAPLTAGIDLAGAVEVRHPPLEVESPWMLDVDPLAMDIEDTITAAG